MLRRLRFLEIPVLLLAVLVAAACAELPESAQKAGASSQPAPNQAPPPPRPMNPY